MKTNCVLCKKNIDLTYDGKSNIISRRHINRCFIKGLNGLVCNNCYDKEIRPKEDEAHIRRVTRTLIG